MTDEIARCERCDKPSGLCVCDRITPHPTRVRVLILQHPQEQDRDLGTASLLLASLPQATRKVGLSWASLAHCLGEEGADPKEWVVLYPATLAKPLSPELQKAPVALVDRHGDAIENRRTIKGVIALDGTWSQAKALWWRNAWFLKCGRAVVHPKEPSIYGRLRREPRREAVSTLESVADTLVALGESEAVRADLRKAFRTMVQRARDVRAGEQATPTKGPPEGSDLS